MAGLRALSPALALSGQRTPKRLTRADIGELLDTHGLTPSRALGQNFLCDPGTIDKIVRLARVGPGDLVAEIGPGLGSLTVALADAGARVLAIEVDKYLIPALREVVSDQDVKILHHDALTLDWDEALNTVSADRTASWSVVANLPYNVSVPLILDLLAGSHRLQRFLVMVQKEVGERLAAGPGSKIYGIPSVLAAYWGTASVVGSVASQVFLPQPRVDSVLVRIERHEVLPVAAPFEVFAGLVRAGFGQRRKMLRRSLSGRVSAEGFAAAEVRPTDRAEQLDVNAWGRLAALADEP